TRKPPPFPEPRPAAWGTQGRYQPGTASNPRKTVALARLHPIRPLWVWRGDPTPGPAPLVTRGGRGRRLLAALGRRRAGRKRGQDQSGEKVRGLDPGLPKRTTDRPTGKRVLEAISWAEITLTRVEDGEGCYGHLSGLPELLKQVLGYLGLSEAVYTRLVINSS